MREQITLNLKEQARAKVLMMMCEGRCKGREAAELLQLSLRHVRRLKQAYREEGPAALAHGNRGRAPAHSIPQLVREQVVALAQADYRGYNHTHLQEELVATHGLTLSRRSLTRILTAAGLRSPKRRRPRRHRARRERSAREGMLLQVDGSKHDWLEGRGPQLVLVGAVDDATGEVVQALFREQEDAQGYLLLLRDIVRERGLPLAWYSDRHSIFQRNGKEPWTLAEELAGRREPTQVARALESLGISLICALSPQAKGRAERCWGTLQDRLVKELRKANASTVEEANVVLQAYLPVFRARFARPPADGRSAYGRLPRGLDLDGVCSFHYVRTVANDNTVRLEERRVDVPPGPRGRSYAGCRVQVQERLDGSLAVVYGDQVIARQAAMTGVVRARRRARGRELAATPAIRTAPDRRRTAASVGRGEAGRRKGPTKPAPDHPWRQSVYRGDSDKITGRLG